MGIAYVGTATNTFGGTKGGKIAYVPALGNTLLMGIVIAGGPVVTVTSVFDDGGIDVFGNPLNSWQNLGTIDFGSARLELWGCCPVRAAITGVEVALSSDNAPNAAAYVAEYSSVATFASYGSVQNTGYNNLFFTGAAPNNTAFMHVLFGGLSGSLSMGSGNVPPQNIPIVPATHRGYIFGGEYCDTGSINSKEELVAEVVTQFLPTTPFAALGVVMNAGLSLNAVSGTAPGFNDIDVDAVIVAGTPGSPDPSKAVRAMTMAQIAANAALGMVRPEFFYTVQVDGDTVPTPVSPVDSYVYSRDELIYVPMQITTFDPASGWTTGQGILFYCMWDVDPDTGKVVSQECYHPDGSSPINKTSDGQLLVLTIGQRAKDGIVMDGQPSLYDVDLSKQYQDAALEQTEVRTLAENSKFAAVKAEVFYMGQAVDGQQLSPPTSTVDGYTYGLDEVRWMSSWLWTSSQAAFAPPPQGAHGGWSQLQRLEASVSSTGLVHCQSFYFNNDEIDPTQPANGGVAYGRLRVYAFCQRKKGPSLALPVAVGSESFDPTTRSYVAVIQGSKLNGTVSGHISVSFRVGSSSTVVSKIVILEADAGTDPITGSTTIYSGGTIPPGAQFTTTPHAFTLSPSKDYYIVMPVTSGNMGFTDITGLLTTSPVVTGNKVTGDSSGATTVSSMSLSISPPPTLARAWTKISMTIDGDTAAPGFGDIPISAFTPGQPLTASVVSQLAKNVKTAGYAIEFFGPTNHAQGDTVALPTSPTDGYTYSRQELLYVWNWHTTANPESRLWGFGGTISASGVVNLMSWHVPAGGPIQNDLSGSSIDVIVIGVRSQVTAATTSNPGTNNGTPPPDFGSIDVSTGQPQFTIGGGS